MSFFSAQPQPSGSEISMPAVAVLVLWVGCLSIGVMGFVLPYARPVAPPRPEPPLQAEILHVELTNDPLPPVIDNPQPAVLQPPAPAMLPQSMPNLPPMTAVAEPDRVAFALPVEGPATIVEPAQASFAAAHIIKDPAPVAPAVQTLTFGQGEGRQPAPEYPWLARRDGQEGVVTIRFTVGENGRVLAANPAVPCAWKLLNDSALRVVRERWRFRPGPVRLYEVSIRFQLTH